MVKRKLFRDCLMQIMGTKRCTLTFTNNRFWSGFQKNTKNKQKFAVGNCQYFSSFLTSKNLFLRPNKQTCWMKVLKWILCNKSIKKIVLMSIFVDIHILFIISSIIFFRSICFSSCHRKEISFTLCKDCLVCFLLLLFLLLHCSFLLSICQYKKKKNKFKLLFYIY